MQKADRLMHLMGSLLVQVYIVFMTIGYTMLSQPNILKPMMQLDEELKGFEDILAHINGGHCSTIWGSTQVCIVGRFLLMLIWVIAPVWANFQDKYF